MGTYNEDLFMTQYGHICSGNNEMDNYKFDYYVLDDLIACLCLVS